MPYKALVEAVSATAGLLPCTLDHSDVKLRHFAPQIPELCSPTCVSVLSRSCLFVWWCRS